LTLNTFLDYGLLWLVVLGGAGLLIMLVLVLLILVIKTPAVSKFVSRILLSPPTLNARLLMGFSFVSIIPAIMLPPLLAVIAVHTLQTDRITQLSGSAMTIGGALNPLINKQASGVQTLAANLSAAGQMNNSTPGDWLLRHHKENPEFVSFWVARPDGEVVAATGSANGVVAPWEGPKAGVALMETFAPSVEKNSLYVSTVIRGVAPRFDPMLILSAPIFDASGKRWGVVQAQLNLREQLSGFIDQGPSSKIHTLIVDAQNQVLLGSSGIGFSQFENLSAHPLVTRMAVAGDTNNYGFKGAVQEFGEPRNFAVAQRTLDNGWRVFIIASQADIETQGMIYFGFLLGWVLLALLLAKSVSKIYGGAVASSLKQLQEALHVFDAEHTMSLIPTAPKDAPREVKQVYDQVRQSMRKSRDAYRDMLRVMGEGEELRRELKHVGHNRKDGASAASKPGAPSPAKARASGAPPSYVGRFDAVTQLAGLEVFEEFFGEAWVMGSNERRPLSLVLLSVCPNPDASAATKGLKVDQAIIKVVATAVRAKITRTLDLVTRIDGDKFGVVLPDTNLDGALFVAHRTQQAVQEAVGEAFLANLGAVTIVPNVDGNARSFISLAHRALTAAEQQGGEVTFFNSEGQIMLLAEHASQQPPEDALALRAETMTVKSIDDHLGTKTVAKPGRQASGGGSAPAKAKTAVPEGSQTEKAKAKEPATADTAGAGDDIIEWDAEF
jgi:diguanylate cyclase (GGDEF)-like protein